MRIRDWSSDVFSSDLQEGEYQPGCGLSPDTRPDSRILLAVQGSVRNDRTPARTLLRLDQGPLRAGSDQHLHAVRPDSVGAAGHSASRYLAADPGPDEGPAYEAEPSAGGSGAGDGYHAPADLLIN